MTRMGAAVGGMDFSLQVREVFAAAAVQAGVSAPLCVVHFLVFKILLWPSLRGRLPLSVLRFPF